MSNHGPPAANWRASGVAGGPPVGRQWARAISEACGTSVAGNRRVNPQHAAVCNSYMVNKGVPTGESPTMYKA